MKIGKVMVGVKRVVDYSAKIRVQSDHKGVDVKQVKMSMNPFCEIAVEEAVRMREKGNASEVIVVSVGPKDGTPETIRTALAMGADRGIHVVTEGRIDQEVESLAVAKILKELILKETPNLVILGKQSIDGDSNQTGQMLAGLMDWPQATFVSKIEPDGSSLSVTREIDGGLQKLSIPLPAVVTADLRLNQPRYSKLPDIMKAKKKKIDIVTAKDLKVDTKPRNTVLSVTDPPGRKAGVKVKDVDELISKLKEAGVL